MLHSTVNIISAFLVGLLAGEEFAIYVGVRSSLSRLDQAAHIAARQELIRVLRVAVPILFLLALATQLVVTAMASPLHGGRGFQLGAVVALLLFIAVTLLGTVPINKAALSWDAHAPPANWRERISAWERLDAIRASLASIAFLLTLAATELR